MQKQLANSFEDELIRAKQELDEAQEQISNLDKKYSKAKKLIKEFQQRYEIVFGFKIQGCTLLM